MYAEIASIEEQHVTQYESIIDPTETWLEKWLLHEASEVYNYYSCAETETDAHIRAIWERFLDYELGHLAFVREAFQSIEGRDPAEVLPDKLPSPIAYESQRNFVRGVLANEIELRANGKTFVDSLNDSPASIEYRRQLNAMGSPSELIASGYVWHPATELAKKAAA